MAQNSHGRAPAKPDLGETTDLPPDVATEDTKGYTGELGSEGGSPSDLTQRERARLNSSATPSSGQSGAPAGRLTFWIIVVALLSVFLWWVLATGTL